MLERIKRHSHLLHKTGMFLSILCLVHCLATPVILTFLPFIAKGWISHTTELYLVGASLIIAVLLMSRDYKAHGSPRPLCFLAISFLINLLGLFFVSEASETLFVVLGSFAMAWAYFTNWKLHRKVCTNPAH
jgi:MerC mercury resistance protein